jgi:hypothetical protein
MISLDMEFKDVQTNGEANNGFESWNDDSMYLKVVKYDEGQIYNLGYSLSSVPFEVITINFREDTI